MIKVTIILLLVATSLFAIPPTPAPIGPVGLLALLSGILGTGIFSLRRKG